MGKVHEVNPGQDGEYQRLAEVLGGTVIPLGSEEERGRVAADQQRAQRRDLNARNYQEARELEPNEAWLERYDDGSGGEEPVLMLTNDRFAVVIAIPLVEAEDAGGVLAEIGVATTDPIPLLVDPTPGDWRPARLYPRTEAGD